MHRDHIGAVQGGDARRFDEILAEDFVCSNPDGSLVDKADFLAETARPVLIQGLAAEDVTVRVVGGVAIIHARTSCTTAEGERRRGRYTDVWAPRAGRWLAVAAHVTRWPIRHGCSGPASLIESHGRDGSKARCATPT